MNTWILLDIAAFCAVAILTWAVIPQILLIAFRKKLFDDTDPRKIHKGTVPRLGGVAFLPCVMFAMLLIAGAALRILPGTFDTVPDGTTAAVCLAACGVTILYLVGINDDLVGVKYRAKFVAQIIAALLVVAGGVQVVDLHGFLWIDSVPPLTGGVLAILLIVFITNSINLIDGIDGLASGLSSLACIFYGTVLFAEGQYLYALLAFAILGALVPFFCYNVFGKEEKKNKIFMGDTGSLTVGLALSLLSLVVMQTPDDVPAGTVIPDALAGILPTGAVNHAAIALAPLLIPCLDVVRVYLRRISAHRNPFLPDKTHIHHKVLALGIPQHTAMAAILAASVVLTIANWLLSPLVGITVLFLADVAVWVIANMLLSHAIRSREKRLGKKLYE